MNTSLTNVPVSPRQGEVGSKKHGGHYLAYKRQPSFDPSATLGPMETNRWKPGCPGDAFYNAVLSNRPKTVAAALELGSKAGFKAREVQNHLRWGYTAGWFEVSGKRFEVAPPAPRAKTQAKTKAPARVS